MKARIRVYCPPAKKQVVLEADLETFKDPLMQLAKPRICFQMRRDGCTFRSEKDCLLRHELQGNFSKDLVKEVFP